MGVSIDVLNYRREFLLRGSLDLRDVLVAAEEHTLPLLGGVDVYDDTTFNRKQMTRLAEELDVIAHGHAELVEAIDSVRLAMTLVREAPHRYLVFNGD